MRRRRLSRRRRRITRYTTIRMRLRPTIVPSIARTKLQTLGEVFVAVSSKLLAMQGRCLPDRSRTYQNQPWQRDARFYFDGDLKSFGSVLCFWFVHRRTMIALASRSTPRDQGLRKQDNDFRFATCRHHSTATAYHLLGAGFRCDYSLAGRTRGHRCPAPARQPGRTGCNR